MGPCEDNLSKQTGANACGAACDAKENGMVAWPG